MVGGVAEFGMDMDTRPYVPWRTHKDLLDSTGNSAQYSNNLMATRGKDGGRDSQGVWDGHGHTAAFNTENQQGPAGRHRELCSVSRGSLDEGEFGGERMHVYVWLSPFPSTCNYPNVVY